ncbi:MAG: N-acetyl-gamma-glutamyl-phosphate reductase [Actinomycetota bacterium]|nr:N-acetyl-gamma-glutamyl-phosphate reductase [Actinomycetota bacterium]
MKRIGIIGASGFTGAELLRICASHPEFKVQIAAADSMSGTKVSDLYPGLAAEYKELVFSPTDPTLFSDCDLVFLCLPHGASQKLVPELIGKVECLVDLGADYRLKNEALYPLWYDESHLNPELLSEFSYGLPELFRDEIKESNLISVPGCFPTAAVLALTPFTESELIEKSGLIVDAATGVSGAGRAPKDNTTFCAVDENYTAYGLLNHRHTPEIEQVLSEKASDEVSVLFTPHLAPMTRGILATCYARPIKDMDTEFALEVLDNYYSEEPFVVVDERSPSTKATFGSNAVHLTARVDPRTGHLIVISAIDNLGKGASGGAVQCANLSLGLPEITGLTTAGVTP